MGNGGGLRPRGRTGSLCVDTVCLGVCGTLSERDGRPHFKSKSQVRRRTVFYTGPTTVPGLRYTFRSRDPRRHLFPIFPSTPGTLCLQRSTHPSPSRRLGSHPSDPGPPWL